MLKKFEVENFKNFGEKLIFDLSTENSYEFNEECVKNGVATKVAIYGHNGSGKSNLGFALFDLISHLTDKIKGHKLYRNYLYAGNNCNMADFKYFFTFGRHDVIYEYGKSEHDTLVYEKIYINNNEFASVDRRLSSIVTINARGAETLNRDIGDSKISIISYIKSNALLDDCIDNNIFHEFITFVNGMLFFRCLDENSFIGLEQEPSNIMEDIIEKGNVGNFENFLNAAGVSCKLAIIESETGKNIAFDFNGKRIRFFDAASQGTKSLALFYFWHQRLMHNESKATFVFIDEFDAFYHHSLSTLVIKTLRQLKIQVLVTTHNTSVMTNELFRPDCYFFIGKNRIKSLSNSTAKELKEAHNIEKMYKAGAFNV